MMSFPQDNDTTLTAFLSTLLIIMSYAVLQSADWVNGLPLILTG